MSYNSEAYDEAERKVRASCKDENDFAQVFIGVLSGRVSPQEWNDALRVALESVKVAA